MSFLRCTPSVFVIGREYEILVNLQSFGLCFVKVGENIYHETCSGVLPSERLVAKIRVPQKALDEAKEYMVVFRETNERKSYFSTFKALQEQKFSFKPLEKKENIHIYHIADVHYRFEEAKKMASYFGDDTDLFVVNGDIGEVETEENFLEVCAFVGEISKGEIPVIFVRGNHDTRGRLAELYPKYFPVENQKTYFSFEVGCLNGIALDCGEDKSDLNEEYDASTDAPQEYRGINRFHTYRQAQLEFLKNIVLETKNKIPFVISHVCPVKSTIHSGSIFDIERELYSSWNEELERLKVKFMLCGHFHRAFVLRKGDEGSLIDHEYPVIVGSIHSKETLMGAAITLNKDLMTICLTDAAHQVGERYEISLN
jgi:Icc-related predicted phosphoesterase